MGFTREPVSSPGDTFFRTANSGFSEPVQQSAQLRFETPAPTSASVDLPATAPAFVETPAPAPAFVAETLAPSETPAPAPAFEESPAPAPAFTTTIIATEASSTQVQTDATTTASPVTPLLPGESLRAAVTVIDLTEETPQEVLDYEVLALVDDIEQPFKTTVAETEATEAPLVRKVFFEIVDGSLAAKEAENESQASAAPTVAAIPEAISTDPVFQEIAKDAEEERLKRGFRAYDPRQSQVYAHKYNDANSNWYYFRRGY